MQLQKLQYIAIFDNLDMNGPVPSEIGMLTSLQMLYLQSNVSMDRLVLLEAFHNVVPPCGIHVSPTVTFATL